MQRNFSISMSCKIAERPALNTARYENLWHFEEAARDLKVIKVENHITEAWPTRLKLRKGQDGSQEEFDVLLGSTLTGVEHYVEWQRTD